jgi:hypothetical protein
VENRRWTVRMQPGTVNGVPAEVRVNETWMPLDAVERPVAPVSPTLWKGASFSEQPWIEARYGGDVPAASYRQTTLGATVQSLSAIRADGAPVIRTAADRRVLMRQTISVVMGLPTLRAVVDPAAAAKGDPDAAQLLVVPAPDATARVIVGAGDPETRESVWAGVPGIQDLTGVQAADARQVIAVLWAVSPAGWDVRTPVPDESWEVFVEQKAFRPLMFGTVLPDYPETVRGGLRLPPLGAGNDIIQSLIDDASRRTSGVVASTTVKWRFWSV